MGIDVVSVTAQQASQLLSGSESQFLDFKAIAIAPGKLTRSVSALANADGGDLYVGIEEAASGSRSERRWSGFQSLEAANGHIQCLESLFPLSTDFQYEFLSCSGHSGIVLHLQITKTRAVLPASDKVVYVRRGAQNIPFKTTDELTRLSYTKGLTSFETERVDVHESVITESDVVKKFMSVVVPQQTPQKWLRKQQLLVDGKATVAGVLLFADEPQALIPKRCGIKVYRYKTVDAVGSRDTLAEDPTTIEGCIYEQIRHAVSKTTEVVESIPRMGEDRLEAIKYPQETLHEIITNAVLHRDYSIADDVHIRVFDNRIEVMSPGRLPAHITVRNILDERFARNGAVVRILNKFPEPPNKDVGEGLNTAFDAMHKLGLKAPEIVEQENSVLVTIKHESLASPEDEIMKYLETHESIKNAEARRITHITADYKIKSIFGRMVSKGMIEQVPNTRTSNTAYRKPRKRGSK